MSDFWKGALFSFVVLIGGGILTQLISVPIAETIQSQLQKLRDYFLDRWAARSQKRLRSRIEKLKAQKSAIAQYIDSSNKFLAFLWFSAIEMVLWTVILLFFYISQAERSGSLYMFLTFWLILFFWTLSRDSAIVRGVRDFDIYRIRVDEQIAALEAKLLAEDNLSPRL